MKHWRHLDTDERVTAIVTLRDTGKSRSEIAADLHALPAQISRFCANHEIDDVPYNKPPSGGWYDLDTDKKIAAIRELDAQGKFKDEIAAALNITVNALHGFCWRNKIDGISMRRVEQVAVADTTAADTRMFVRDARPVRADAWTPLCTPVSLERNSGCCWPVDGGFCGDEKRRDKDGNLMRGSYCEIHHAMAYRPQTAGYSNVEDALVNIDQATQPKRNQPVRVQAPHEAKKKIWRPE